VKLGKNEVTLVQCVNITNEDNAHHYLQYQGYCSLLIHSTRPNSQPSLLCGSSEVVKWRCA